MSNHSIHIKTGKHALPTSSSKRTEALNEIEDVLHLIFNCTLCNDMKCKLNKKSLPIMETNINEDSSVNCS